MSGFSQLPSVETVREVQAIAQSRLDIETQWDDTFAALRVAAIALPGCFEKPPIPSYAGSNRLHYPYETYGIVRAVKLPDRTIVGTSRNGGLLDRIEELVIPHDPSLNPTLDIYATNVDIQCAGHYSYQFRGINEMMYPEISNGVISAKRISETVKDLSDAVLLSDEDRSVDRSGLVPGNLLYFVPRVKFIPKPRRSTPRRSRDPQFV